MVRLPASVSGSSAGTGPWRQLVDSVLSLQCKATVLLVVVTLAVTAGVSGYLLRYSAILAREQHHEQLAQAAAMLPIESVAAEKLGIPAEALERYGRG